MAVLENLEPKAVFGYFEDICKIPHGSGNMEQISQYCVDFAKAHGLEYIQDEMKNVILIKEASKGYESVEPIILQGHLDMVCEKAPEKELDFLTQGLDLRTDGEKIWADGTTLGGDDGIAVAYALAILADDRLEHPRLEVVFTVDEETGLYGAEAIDLSMLKGKKLINMDSEEEGYLLTSCAGGLTQNCQFPLEWETAEGTACRVRIQGLKGGHSGAEINQGRGNSNQLLGRFLLKAADSLEFQIAAMSGGLKDNAIPRFTEAVLILKPENLLKLELLAENEQKVWRRELHASDPKVQIEIEKLEDQTREVLTEDSARKVVQILNNIPNGIQNYSMDVAGLVETSLNMGIMKLTREGLELSFAVRSSLETAKQYLADRVRVFTEILGGSSTTTGAYPGWAYAPKSELRDTMILVYEKLYGKKPVVQAIHAGLECGMFMEKIPDLDCISFGPNMHHVHTTEEYLEIASVQRCYEYLLAVLKEK